MTIVVRITNTEKAGGRQVEVKKEHHSPKTTWRDETSIIDPQQSQTFTLWGAWTLTIKENEPLI